MTASRSFGDLQLNAEGDPLAHGQPLRLPARAQAVLKQLILKAPQSVSKDEFAREVWRDDEMSDEGLARNISRVRSALLPLGVNVRAIYGRGYQLFGEPKESITGLSAFDDDSLVHAKQLVLQRTPDAMSRAIQILRRLVAVAPRSGEARVALAEALAAAIGWGTIPTEAAVDEGLAAVADVGTACPDARGRHAAVGTLLDLSWRFADARKSFDLALAQDGEHVDTLIAYARHLLYTDDAEQAVDVLKRLRELAPYTLHVRMTLARALVQAGKGAEALEEARATRADHPGQLVASAFHLAIQALVAPTYDLEASARRLIQGPDTPPFTWTVAAFVLARLKRKTEAMAIIETSLSRPATSVGEASLYAAPLAALGEFNRAADLLREAVNERCGMVAMVLRDPAHGHWLKSHRVGKGLLGQVFGTPLQ